jgi:peptidoglycan L-alanyl-D-glutamate endopeptidase CwlK
MGVDPHGLLAHVHPDLVKVILAASQAPQPFQIVQGLRTLSEEQYAVATGHSHTLHSRHLPDPAFPGTNDPAGLAMAIDFACLVGGQVYWTVANAAGGCYGIAAAQIRTAAQMLGVKIQWGGQSVGAWADGQVSHFRDWGHIQLDPSAYA